MRISAAREPTTENSSSIRDSVAQICVRTALLENPCRSLENHDAISAIERRIFEHHVQINQPPLEISVFQLEPVNTELGRRLGVHPTRYSWYGVPPDSSTDRHAIQSFELKTIQFENCCFDDSRGRHGDASDRSHPLAVP